MFRRHNRFIVAVFVALAAAGIALISGCADLIPPPLAPQQTAAGQAVDGKHSSSSGPFTIAFLPQTLPRVAKKAMVDGLQIKTVSGWFSPDKTGKLAVSFKTYADGNQVQVKQATFEVETGAIGAAHEITMTVFSGYTLADVAVQFSPSELTFDPPATLTLVLWGAEIDPAEIQAYHISGGTVESISVEVDESGKKKVTVKIKVPGFSIYSLSGNN